MPEPKGIAKLVGEVVLGVYRFTMHDDRIDSESDGYVVVEKDRLILIDPLPMNLRDLKKLGTVGAICLTASCHERAAWRYQRSFKVPVYAPRRAVDFEGTKPDRWYGPGARLPGGLKAVHSPGPTDAHYSFYLRKGGGVVFCADLLTNDEGEGLAFVPDEYQDDPNGTRVSVKRLLDLPFRVLCPNHGDPVKTGAKKAIRRALAQDAAEHD
ncbi:MAG TPA: MBL fold metallo-hydrolase [Nitrospirales bacterium]|nr:MBL fold metallo-hydrolase [Nitrospirales bacterium]